MKAIFIILCMWFMIAMPVQADTFSIEFGVYTSHLDYADWMNEDNGLIGFEYRNGDIYYNATTFTNTYDDRSNTLGIGYNLLEYEFARLDILAGGATGYDSKNMLTIFGIVPYIAPRVTLVKELTKAIAVKASVQQFWTATEITVGFEYKF